MTKDGERRRRHLWLAKASAAGVAVLAVAAAVVVALLALGIVPAVPSEDRRTRTLERPITVPPGADARGRLVLDVEARSLTVEPGPPGTPVRVEAEYDASAFDLSEELAQEPGGAWTHEIRFARSVRGARRVLTAHRAPPTLRIVVPRALPLSIEARIPEGRSELELGGLSLEAVRVWFGRGHHALRFSEATSTALRELAIVSSAGQVTVAGLGHASPASVRARHGIGQLRLDLDGSWSRGTDVDVGATRFGNIEVRVPAALPLVIRETEEGVIGVVELPEGLPDVPEAARDRAVRLSAVARNGSVRVVR